MFGRLKSGALVDNIYETLQKIINMGSSYEFWIVRKIPHLIVLLYAADKLVADKLSIIEIMESCSCDQTSHIETTVFL